MRNHPIIKFIRKHWYIIILLASVAFHIRKRVVLSSKGIIMTKDGIIISKPGFFNE